MKHGALPLFLYGLLICAGCAPAGVRPDLNPADPVAAQNVWTRFEAVSHNAETLAAPFRINATLYYAGKEDSQRVTVYFWGNQVHGDARAIWPLRMDILMGPGSVMAMIAENGSDFTVYVPRDATAYYYTGDGPALLAFGVPVPFSLADLSLLLTGQYRRLFLDRDALDASSPAPPAYAGKNGSTLYALDARNGRSPGLLELSPDGLPLNWRESGGNGWTLSLEYREDSTRTTPRKVQISHPKGGEATLVVRELARVRPFAPGQLELALPLDTAFAPLRPQNR